MRTDWNNWTSISTFASNCSRRRITWPFFPGLLLWSSLNRLCEALYDWRLKSFVLCPYLDTNNHHLPFHWSGEIKKAAQASGRSFLNLVRLSSCALECRWPLPRSRTRKYGSHMLVVPYVSSWTIFIILPQTEWQSTQISTKEMFGLKCLYWHCRSRRQLSIRPIGTYLTSSKFFFRVAVGRDLPEMYLGTFHLCAWMPSEKTTPNRNEGKNDLTTSPNIK